MSDQNNDLMTLKTQASEEPPRAQTQPPSEANMPLLGLFAVGFGVLGIVTYGPVFVPLALILGVIALFLGQIGLGLLAIVLAVIGVITSPTLWVMLGLGVLAAWFGF